MTRREKALLAARRIRRWARIGGDEVVALADEYDDLLAFYDAAVEEGLSEAHEAHKVYCENQGTRGPQNG